MPIFKKKLTKPRKLTLREYYDRRKRVLVIRHARGLGDVLMHRMVFDDFKRVMPDAEIVFATLPEYHAVAGNHPAVDEVIDSTNLDLSQFVVSYNNSQCCLRYEIGKAPIADKHRADIWAEHCGVKLTTHDMHLDALPHADKDDIEHQLYDLGWDGRKPKVVLCPIAHDALRTLTETQLEAVLDELKDCFVYIVHDTYPLYLRRFNVPVIKGTNLEHWRGLIDAADYVVTVDTSSFHYAGGRGKPMCGIFTYADGKYRGQYFDFVLVQKHRDDGDWPCGPCYNWMNCTHPEVQGQTEHTAKPCLLKLTPDLLRAGIRKMFDRWPSKTPSGLNT